MNSSRRRSAGSRVGRRAQLTSGSKALESRGVAGATRAVIPTRMLQGKGGAAHIVVPARGL
jgi:hypothetical protein